MQCVLLFSHKAQHHSQGDEQYGKYERKDADTEEERLGGGHSAYYLVTVLHSCGIGVH